MLIPVKQYTVAFTTPDGKSIKRVIGANTKAEAKRLARSYFAVRRIISVENSGFAYVSPSIAA